LTAVKNLLRAAMAAMVFCLAFGGAASAQSSVLLHPMFADHAVLQRDQPIRVYGRAGAGEAVTVSLGAARAQATADASGAWSAALPAAAAGGPYELTARSASGASQTAHDVIVGDVYLCSGQSNMVLQVRRALDSRAEIQNSANNNIRQLNVGLATSLAPLDTFAAPVEWQAAAPAVAADWSATCYYFARELRKSVDVPVGLVVSAWGGSNIRPWMSQAALHATGLYDDALAVLALHGRDHAAAVVRWSRVWRDWWRKTVPSAGEPWSAGRIDAHAWRDAPEGLGYWEEWGDPDLANYDGLVWHRTSVRLTAAQARGAARLSLGPIDQADTTWVNGRPVGYTSGAGTDRLYDLPAGVLHAGDNVIAIAAVDTYKSGGMYGPPEKRFLRLANGGQIPLHGAWRYRAGPANAFPPYAPWESTGGMTTIYNAMIAPIGRYNFRGVVWYQGESNTSEPQTYQRLLAGLMADWRDRFAAPDLPFLIVQLAGYGAPTSTPVESGTAAVREAQRLAVLDDPRAGLAVAVDIGERFDVHPANKQELGRRLARAARHVIFGEAIAPSGPIPRGARRVGSDIVVSFGDVEGGFVAYSADAPIGFELCGANAGSCRFAVARLDGTDVHLSAANGAAATRVRHCWADSPVCTLYDRAGLPAGPFEIAIQ
jgi:sialate O-acetylesterase